VARPHSRTASSLSSWGLAWDKLGVYALLLFVVVVWGGSFVAARMILAPTNPGDATLSPTLLAAVRFLMASAIFLPILVRQHIRVQALKLSDIPLFLLLGQLGISVYFWLQYTGVQLTNAGISAVIVVGLIPLATMLISGLTLREPLGVKRAAALALGAGGVAVVVSQRGLDVAVKSGFLFGVVALIANALCFAVYSTWIRGLRTRYASLTTTAAMTIAGTLGLVLMSLFSEDWGTVAALSTFQWGVIVYLALICSVMAYFFYNYALSKLEAAKASVWIYLEPPIAIALGAMLLGEIVAFQTVVGGLVILASLYLTHRS
jgi:drug/metabolite transporter (DMT)-like permease